MEDPSIRDKSQCASHQLALQKCIKNEVTVYRNIEANCSETIAKYQDCIMKDTEGNSSSKCYNELVSLRECAMNTIKDEQEKSG